MAQQQTEIPQSQSAIYRYKEQIEKAAIDFGKIIFPLISNCKDEYILEQKESICFVAGAEYALQLQQEEIDELVFCLKQLLELHLKAGDNEHDDQHNWSVEEILSILDNCRKLILKYENNKN